MFESLSISRFFSRYGTCLMLVTGILATGFGCFSNPEARLHAFLEKHQATPVMAAAYRFALKHPEVLKHIPCYCGCNRLGHQSNYHCFVQENTRHDAAGEIVFDDHGLVCPMCVQIALIAQEKLHQGLSLKDIREEIDRVFTKYPHLHATDTPKPN